MTRRLTCAVIFAVGAVAAVAIAGDHWFPLERWFDEQLRDAACSVDLLSGRHCQDPTRPRQSVVPWAIGLAALFGAFIGILSFISMRRGVLLGLGATIGAMSVATVVVRHRDTGFGPLGRTYDVTSGDCALLLVSVVLLVLFGWLLTKTHVARAREGTPGTTL